MTRKTITEKTAREAFERALATHDQDFGKFFLARLFGCEFDTRMKRQGVVRPEDFMLNPQGGLHGGVIASCWTFPWSPAVEEGRRGHDAGK